MARWVSCTARMSNGISKAARSAFGRDQWEMFQVAIRSEPEGSGPGGEPGIKRWWSEDMGLMRPQG